MLIQFIFFLIWLVHATWSLSVDIGLVQPDDEVTPWALIMEELFTGKAFGETLRIIKTFGIEQLRIYDDHCERWTLHEFLLVRRFVLETPQYAQFLLSPKCYNLLSAEIIKYHSSMAEKDFDQGLFSSMMNPILRSSADIKSKFAALIEKIGSRPDHFQNNFLKNGLFLYSDPTPGSDYQLLFIANLYRILASDPIGLLASKNMSKMAESLDDYVKNNFRKDPSDVYKVLSSYLGLKATSPLNKELYQLSINRLTALDKEIRNDALLMERSSTWRLLYDSLRLCAQQQHPYDPQHELPSTAIQTALQKIDEIGLLKYAYILVRMSSTPFETCRYFLGPENLKRLYQSPGLSLYIHARLCLTREEFLINLRKWHLYHDSEHHFSAPLNNLPAVLDLSDHLFRNMSSRYSLIASQHPRDVIQDCIRSLLNMLVEMGVLFEASGKEGDEKISFNLKHLKDNSPQIALGLQSLITFIIYKNFHYDYSVVLADKILGGILVVFPKMHSLLSLVYNINLEKPTD